VIGHSNQQDRGKNVNLPGHLNAAITAWLDHHGRGGLAQSALELSNAYRKGETSAQVNLAAYVATRVPATFEANTKVQHALAAALPHFAPQSLLDMGAGPGVATWAAVAAWRSIEKVTLCEQDKKFAELAATLNAASAFDVLVLADIILKSEATLPADVTADLVTVSYMLAELPQEQMSHIATRLWARAKQVLVVIEPGTPNGFARLRALRDTLLQQGAFVLAPCTHQNICPIAAKDWCHFKARVQRSREHMHAKQASVPFEDEAFSYLVLSREVAPQSGGRIIAPVIASKPGITMRVCDATGCHDERVASRDKPTYKRAKKMTWGQVWE
jgi:ribosomal protein RSM22 (predicted rRNA methylase)